MMRGGCDRNQKPLFVRLAGIRTSEIEMMEVNSAGWQDSAWRYYKDLQRQDGEDVG
jgi:hypothetical protein